MEKIATGIAKLLVRENLIEESAMEIYQYGLVRMLELSGAIFTSFLLCLAMGMLKEGIIFFAFFMPLRSFLGGFHLKKYWQCYMMSCCTLFAVLMITKAVTLDAHVSSMLIVLTVIGIGWEAWRERKEPEKKVFARIVWGVLAVLLAVTAFCAVRKQEAVLVLLGCVTTVVWGSKMLERAVAA